MRAVRRYDSTMAHAVKATEAEQRRRHAAERLRGLFAHIAPDRKLVDEMIAERRAEARQEDLGSAARADSSGR